jgi:hypothetical protein
MDETQVDTMIQTLAADGPWPEHADKLMLFGRFVGAWDVEASYYDEDGNLVGRQQGEWHFGWVLQGRAIQDVLFAPRRGAPDTGSFEYGTTVRFYDPRRDEWRVAWLGPVNGVCTTLVARADAEGIVLEGPTKAGGLHRWTFSEITDDFFHWRGYRAPGADGPWHLEEEMLVSRRR